MQRIDQARREWWTLLLPPTASLLLTSLIVIVDRRLLWLLVVLLPPIWVPVLVTLVAPSLKERPDLLDRAALAVALVGAVIVAALAFVV